MFGRKGVFAVRRCSSCGLCFTDPMLSLKKARIFYPSMSYYSYLNTNDKSFFGRLRNYMILHSPNPTFLYRFLSLFIYIPAIPKWIDHGKILDVGCGNGATISLLEKLGWNVYGIDVNPRAIRVAHTLGLKNVKRGTYKDIKEYPDNFFDVVRLYEVIEHLDRPDVCLSLIYKKLKKGGQCIIGTSNFDSLVRRIFNQYWYNLDVPRHTYQFTPVTLTRLMTSKGFKVILLRYCSGGGWVGSIQYVLEQIFTKRIDLIHNQLLVLFVYPFEWILDKMRVGDIFVVVAEKELK